jgi:hypothetical protein
MVARTKQQALFPGDVACLWLAESTPTNTLPFSHCSEADVAQVCSIISLPGRSSERRTGRSFKFHATLSLISSPFVDDVMSDHHP